MKKEYKNFTWNGSFYAGWDCSPAPWPKPRKNLIKQKPHPANGDTPRQHLLACAQPSFRPGPPPPPRSPPIPPPASLPLAAPHVLLLGRLPRATLHGGGRRRQARGGAVRVLEVAYHRGRRLWRREAPRRDRPSWGWTPPLDRGPPRGERVTDIRLRALVDIALTFGRDVFPENLRVACFVLYMFWLNPNLSCLPQLYCFFRGKKALVLLYILIKPCEAWKGIHICASQRQMAVMLDVSSMACSCARLLSRFFCCSELLVR